MWFVASLYVPAAFAVAETRAQDSCSCCKNGRACLCHRYRTGVRLEANLCGTACKSAGPLVATQAMTVHTATAVRVQQPLYAEHSEKPSTSPARQPDWASVLFERPPPSPR